MFRCNNSVALLFALALLLPGTTWASPDVPQGVACEELDNLSIADITPLAATAIRFEEGNRPSVRTANGAVELPDYCRVRATVLPKINFELRLPLNDWNGKFYMAGCGGFCGKVLADRPGYSNAINVALVRNYAAVTSDSGHWAPHGADGVWAYNNRSAEIDYSYRVIPEVARAAKAIIAAFYGAAESHSYFSGCSNGGRMGALAIQRYPDLFDGVLVGAPALDWRTLAMYSSWVMKANTDENGKLIFDYRKTALLAGAVMAHCDTSDGLKDGQITDPRQCDFDPAVLQCPDNNRGLKCLTKTEVQIVRKWYQGLPDTHGPDWSYKVPLGSEPYWPRWLTPPPGRPGAFYLFGDALHKYIVHEQDPGPAYSPVDMDLNRYPVELDYMRELYRADNPDLTAFRDAGGKAIFYQGWADPAAVPEMTIGYYEDVRKQMGGQSETDRFLRLFMVPGAGHCWESPHRSPDIFNPIDVLDNWVENGVAPARIDAGQYDETGKLIRSRPLCSYPDSARYKGSGSIDDASNFSCK
jgi:feruloyl esterase